MKKVDVMIAIERTTALLHVYRDLVSVRSSTGGDFLPDEDIKKVAREISGEMTALVHPAGQPCPECGGSGVKPEDNS